MEALLPPKVPLHVYLFHSPYMQQLAKHSLNFFTDCWQVAALFSWKNKKYPTKKISAPFFRPPSKATPPKRMTVPCLATVTALLLS